MAIRVAINGFGRIGRLVLRAYMEAGRDDLEFVAIKIAVLIFHTQQGQFTSGLNKIFTTVKQITTIFSFCCGFYCCGIRLGAGFSMSKGYL